MAKKNVVIFDGEDKFINPKKAVYSKTRGQSKSVESFKSVRAGIEDEQGPTQSVSEGIADDTVNNQASMGAPVSSSPVSQSPASYNPTVAAPVDVPSPTEIASAISSVLPSVTTSQETRNTGMPSIGTSTITQETAAAPAYTAPTPQLPNATPSGGSKTCPEGMRLYYGTCIPITNTQGACQQGYMKEYEGGPCVPIPASDAIGNCAAGYEYKMGMRAGSFTPEMGCFPIGSTQDIGSGSSTGAILGGGAGSNIGGGGNVQGGGGTYVESPEKKRDAGVGLTCNENQVYDAVTGSCIGKYTPAPVPCPAGYVLNEATGTCIQSTNPQDYKCPPVDLPKPPLCKKYAVVGKDQFGCDRYDLVDDADNCPSVKKTLPYECQDGLIWSIAEEKCVNPIKEEKRPPLTTPEGTCPVGFRWNIPAQKCVPLCEVGLVWDPVNLMCVAPKTDDKGVVKPTPPPYCSQNMIWDEKQQKCVFSGTVAPAPVTSQTTTTTTKAPSDTLGILPVTPIGGGGTSGGGGGGGGAFPEEGGAAAVAKKNYFWWYVGGAVLAYYLYKKYKKKN